jgi:hypothetical protein
LPARGCSPATSAVGGACVRQTGGAHRLLASRQWCCRGCSLSRPPCSPVSPRASAHPTLLSWPCAGAHSTTLPPLGHQRAPCTTADLRTGIKLRNNEPPFVKQQGDIVLGSACCKPLFQVFQMFQRCVASVSHRCCKSRSGCCTCCNGYTCMFQCFICFIRMLQVFHLDVAKVDLDVVYICKCFKFFHTYVVNGFI